MVFFPSLFEQFRSVETAHFSSCLEHLHLLLRRGIKHSPESRALVCHRTFPISHWSKTVTIRAPCRCSYRNGKRRKLRISPECQPVERK